MYYFDYIGIESEYLLKSQIEENHILAARKLKYNQIKKEILNGYNLKLSIKELNELKMELLKGVEIKN